MNKIQFKEMSIKDVYLIHPLKVEDDRGGLIKDYSEEMFQQRGINLCVKETFSIVSKRGVLRGLHFQDVFQQKKVINCIKGRVFCVVVDLRMQSVTYKRWLGIWLEEKNDSELYIPEECAMGTLTINDSILMCKYGENFKSEYNSGILWNDKTLGIQWPVDSIGGEENLIISEKDSKLSSFMDWERKEKNEK